MKNKAVLKVCIRQVRIFSDEPDPGNSNLIEKGDEVFVGMICI